MHAVEVRARQDAALEQYVTEQLAAAEARHEAARVELAAALDAARGQVAALEGSAAQDAERLAAAARALEEAGAEVDRLVGALAEADQDLAAVRAAANEQGARDEARISLLEEEVARLREQVGGPAWLEAERMRRAEAGVLYPREDSMSGLLDPDVDWRIEEGASDGYGGRVFKITRPDLIENTVFACAVVNQTDGARLRNCILAGNNPDVIQAQRDSRKTNLSAAAVVTNFGAGTLHIEHSVAFPGWWKENRGAARWATIWSFNLWGGNFDVRFSRIEGACDQANLAGAPGALDDGTGQRTAFLGCDIAPRSFYANQLVATPYYSVQSNPSDPRGGATHDDGVQTSTNGNIHLDQCVVGGPHVKTGLGTAYDPGPVGMLIPGSHNAALMIKQEPDSRYPAARTRLRNVRVTRSWLWGAMATVNGAENQGNLLSDGIELVDVRIAARAGENAGGHQVRFSSTNVGIRLVNVREWDPAAGPFTDTGKVITPVID